MADENVAFTGTVEHTLAAASTIDHPSAELAEWIEEKALAAAASEEIVEDLHAYVLPEGCELVKIDTTDRRDRPRRMTGAVTVKNLASFNAYVMRHKLDGTTIWAADPKVIAVINDHEDAQGEPGWGDHRATLLLEHTPSWKRWADANNKLLTQEEFAELVEAGIPDILTPPAADLLEIAQSLRAHKSASFESDKRLSNGQVQFKYVETVTASAGKSGQFEIPTEITLRLAPYLGLEPVPVLARFRYRLVEGHLRLGFAIDRLPELLIEVFERLCASIAEATDITPFTGTPR